MEVFDIIQRAQGRYFGEAFQETELTPFAAFAPFAPLAPSTLGKYRYLFQAIDRFRVIATIIFGHRGGTRGGCNFTKFHAASRARPALTFSTCRDY